MSSRLEVLEAMDFAKVHERRFANSKEHLKGVLKSYALYEVACMCRKYPGKEVLLTSLDEGAALYVSGVPRKTSEISKRFNMARLKYGRGSYPLGLFLGVDGNVSFTPQLQ